jgi:DNA-binding NtrC family response regulator
MSNDIVVAPDIEGLPKSILVVEDNIALRFTLAEWLRICGYTVYEAATADEAVTVLQSPITINIVVTDVDMPGSMNGLGLVDHIKSAVSGVEVIVVSGDASGHQVKEKEVVFFKKPYDLQAVSSCIEEILQVNSTETDK